MTRDEVLRTLREAEPALRLRGVAHAALFGSLARGETGPASDVDIMVEIRPGADLDLFAYVSIIHMIQDLFDVPVDVADRAGLKPLVRPSAERDAVYAF